MKRLIIVNGTMGVGKTAVCTKLYHILNRSVFLDGDWCWMMDPFVVTDETKQMVRDNIIHLLRNFLTCSEYENIIFCWVMQYESIMDDFISRLAGLEFESYKFTLTISERALIQRVQKDVEDYVRTSDVLERSLQRLPLYETMHTVKIDVSEITAQQAAEQIRNALSEGCSRYRLPTLHSN
jgi:adenylate kinase family enzyme